MFLRCQTARALVLEKESRASGADGCYNSARSCSDAAAGASVSQRPYPSAILEKMQSPGQGIQAKLVSLFCTGCWT